MNFFPVFSENGRDNFRLERVRNEECNDTMMHNCNLTVLPPVYYLEDRDERRTRRTLINIPTFLSLVL